MKESKFPILDTALKDISSQEKPDTQDAYLIANYIFLLATVSLEQSDKAKIDGYKYHAAGIAINI